MSNRPRPKKPWLRIPRRPNVADLAWAAHREHQRKMAELAAAEANTK